MFTVSVSQQCGINHSRQTEEWQNEIKCLKDADTVVPSETALVFFLTINCHCFRANQMFAQRKRRGSPEWACAHMSESGSRSWTRALTGAELEKAKPRCDKSAVGKAHEYQLESSWQQKCCQEKSSQKVFRNSHVKLKKSLSSDWFSHKKWLDLCVNYGWRSGKVEMWGSNRGCLSVRRM